MGNQCIKKTSHDDDTTASGKTQEQHTREYFSLIKKNVQMFLEENQKSLFHMSTNFEKKGFLTFPRQEEKTKDNKFVNWKVYIITYLQKKTKKGIPWASELLTFVKREPFLSENKWLSLFFWQEFEMRTKPKCLNTKKRIDIDGKKTGTSSSSNWVLDEMSNRMRGGSLTTINTEGLPTNDPAHDYKQYRAKVKEYLRIFNEHISDPDHPIYVIAENFVKVLTKDILVKRNEISEMKKRNEPHFKEKVTTYSDEVTKHMQKFILKLQTGLRLLYAKTINYQCFVEEKDEFINIVTSLVFSLGSIYDQIMELYKLAYENDIRQFDEKLNRLKDIMPNELGIDQKYCLNDSTLEFMKKILEEKKRQAEGISNVEVIKITCAINNVEQKISGSEYYLDESSDTQSYQDLDSSTNAINKTGTFVNTHKSKFAYCKCSNILRTISQFKVPCHKMILISSLSNHITECVTKFWKDLEYFISATLLNIDADELMMIFIYIIIRAQMPELVIHSKFIKQFTASATRSSMIGYYYTTMEASIAYILEIKEINELLDKEKLRKACIVQDEIVFQIDKHEEDGKDIFNMISDDKLEKYDNK